MLRALRVPLARRSFTTSLLALNSKGAPTNQSLFSDVTQINETSAFSQLEQRIDSIEQETGGSGSGDSGSGSTLSRLQKYKKQDVQFQTDPDVVRYTKPPALKPEELLLSPLKRQLYQLSMDKGGYNPDQILELDGKRYRLKLSTDELKALEPSVYLKSYRIKSSYKKATLFLRMLRGLPLKQAITQCHFSPKIIARDVGEMLTRGLDDSKQLGQDPENMYVNQIWVGKDGGDYKRVDFKARGRMGIITHKFVHVRAILKTQESRDQFEQARRQRKLGRRVRQQLVSKPIHAWPKGSAYKW